MRIEYLPTEYLVYVVVVRGDARSPKTWMAKAYALLPFLDFMVEQGFSISDPTEEQLAHYRNSLEQKGITRERIARVMNVICGFYEWSHRKGFSKALPFSMETHKVQRHGLLAHVQDTRLTSRSVLIPKFRRSREGRMPKFFQPKDQARILDSFDERDRLIVEWGLFTGLREFEICALRIHQIPSQESYRGRLTAIIRVTETKFGKAADLRVPAWLLDKTYQYIAFFGRPAIVRAARLRGSPEPPDNIFLARWGTDLNPDSVYNLFKDALKTLDIKGTFHDLRHTFAICTLDSLMRSERYAGSRGMEALLVLQVRMRHERISSTMIYLRAREFYLDDIDSGLWDLPVTEAEAL